MILFETLNQSKIVLFLLIFGFLSGLIFDFNGLIVFLCNKNKIVKNLLLCLSVCLSSFVLLLINITLNYGQLRFYIFALFIGMVILERLTLGKLVALTYDKCYNLFRKVVSYISKKWKTKKTKENLK